MDIKKETSTNNEEKQTINTEEATVLNKEDNQIDDINTKLNTLTDAVQNLVEIQKQQFTSIQNVRPPVPTEDYFADSGQKRIEKVINRIERRDFNFDKQREAADIMIAQYLLDEKHSTGKYNIPNVEKKMKEGYIKLDAEDKIKEAQIQPIYDITT